MDWKWFIRDLASTSSTQIGCRNEDEASRIYAVTLVRGIWGDKAANQAADILGCSEHERNVAFMSTATPAGE